MARKLKGSTRPSYQGGALLGPRRQPLPPEDNGKPSHHHRHPLVHGLLRKLSVVGVSRGAMVLCVATACAFEPPVESSANDIGKAGEPTRPALGYTVASFWAEHWATDFCLTLLATVAEQGFGVATFTPSYAYLGASNAGEPLIDASAVPSIDDLARCFAVARDFGLDIAYKPHLDGGWRGEFDFDPGASESYFDLLLRPAITAMAELGPDVCDDCTITIYLGTELARSTKKYPMSWARLADEVRTAAREANVTVRVTVDLMHDVTSDLTPTEFVRRFFAKLDHLSISQYTPLNVHEATPDGVVMTLEDYDVRLRAFLVAAGLPRDARIDFGEFGIGTGGLAAPWAYSGTERNEAETTVGVEGILRFVAQQDPSSMGVANLWTVGKIYDVMGNHGENGNETAHGGRPSPTAKALIEAYNRGD